MSRKLTNLRAMLAMLFVVFAWSVSAQTNAVTDISAQKVTITGEITDVTGEPIIGAIVMIQNTNIGTTTDIDGCFTLNASNHDILVVAYVGMQTQEIPITDEHHIKVVMKDAKMSLYKRIKYFILNLFERFK